MVLHLFTTPHFPLVSGYLYRGLLTVEFALGLLSEFIGDSFTNFDHELTQS